MKILINEPSEKSIRLWLPNILLFNGFTAWIISAIARSKAKKEGASKTALQFLRAKHFRRLFYTMRRAGKTYKKAALDLVNIESQEGEKIIIKL